MNDKAINGLDLLSMLESGTKCLALKQEEINALNVFPVPDGDTGSNMKATMEGGVGGGRALFSNDIGAMSKAMAKAMVLSARGNSGVILSQFFKGLSLGLDGCTEVNVAEFARAMVSGTARAYDVVAVPTEGTILTVMRKAGEEALVNLNADTGLEDYLIQYLAAAENTLRETPELLPVLKKAGVIDSGGAGFVLIIEGMLRAVNGDGIEDEGFVPAPKKKENHSDFTADSVLIYGYCTEFILQLQRIKVDIERFDLMEIKNFLEQHGNSIVCFQEEDMVKVHIHTFDPGIILTECRKYGEFITLKIENMNVQHTETAEYFDAMRLNPSSQPHKEYGLVAVANGRGLAQAFRDMGVDRIVAGGQTMNASTEDFIKAFEQIDADTILVYPNNKNIVMAARVAADSYERAHVYVVPTHTIAEGYSAISMLNFDSGSIDSVLQAEMSAIQGVRTLELTYAVRDTDIGDIHIRKNDWICLLDGELAAADTDRITAMLKALKCFPDFEDKQIATIVYGKDVSSEEATHIQELILNMNPYMEIYLISGEQEIYSYIIGLE